MTKDTIIEDDDFGPEHFLELGQQLLDQHTSAATRTAVSRFYHANFLLAAEKLAAKRGYRPRNDGGDHSGLIRFMKSSGGRLRAAGLTLEQLRFARTHADYHTSGDDDCDYCPNAPVRSEFSPAVTSELHTKAIELFRQLESL